MKKIITAFFILLSCASMASAQTNRAFRKGYQGDIEIGNYAVFGKGKYGGLVQVSTTHGYRTGTGMFLGVGFGVAYDLATEAYPEIPVFMDAKYNFLDTEFSPYASVRTGVRICGESHSEIFQPFIAIAAGVDVGRFSVKLGYDYGNLRLRYYDRYNRIEELTKPSQLFCSFAFKF
ncbi:MAG: hypothetical protein J6W98_05860 [Bacteroidales bacterium]|nr:hypothetical protein [Bacteroidales bacterium]